MLGAENVFWDTKTEKPYMHRNTFTHVFFITSFKVSLSVFLSQKGFLTPNAGVQVGGAEHGAPLVLYDKWLNTVLLSAFWCFRIMFEEFFQRILSTYIQSCDLKYVFNQRDNPCLFKMHATVISKDFCT